MTRPGWTFAIATSHDEVEALDDAFWARASPEQRLDATLEPSMAAYALSRYEDPDAPPPRLEELLAAFDAEEVRYVLVGGYAVSLHSKPRATKDIDLWIDGGENLARDARARDLRALARARDGRR